MESGGSYDRRGSVISPSGFFADHPIFTSFGNLGSSSIDVVDIPTPLITIQRDNSSIPMHRSRGMSETQYADTEVIEKIIIL